MKGRWQDWVNLVLGAWLFFSPWILQYATGGPGAWNSYVFGIGIVVFAAIALFAPQKWEEWVNFALGVWLIISPWVLEFRSDVATWNVVILGILVGIFSLSGMATQPAAPVATRRP